ncbi:hypothetical protein O0L34_g18133 [Tuta absoluta]|nr:hypothetical protein O0L34_g18133 [Tuta absoluta]
MKHKPDILALNETWMNVGEESLAPELPEYNLLLRLRGSKGGGVGFFVRREIIVRKLQHPAAELEQMWLQVQLPGATLALGTAYRPERIGVQDALDALSESICSMARCDYLCFLGDMNIDLALVDSPKGDLE